MAERIAFELNGETQTVEVAPDTPLLCVLRNELGQQGAFLRWARAMRLLSQRLDHDRGGALA
jgi:hypothetical protein